MWKNIYHSELQTYQDTNYCAKCWKCAENELTYISSCGTIPDGLVVRIRRSHRRGRGSIPRLGELFW